MKFWLTDHVKKRYIERVVNGVNNFENLNVSILKHISTGKDITNKVYDECPRYILFLYEKYKQLGITIMLANDVLFITKKRKGTYDLYDVLTCYPYTGDYLRTFKTSVLPREIIFMKIKEIKRKLK